MLKVLDFQMLKGGGSIPFHDVEVTNFSDHFHSCISDT